jgi:hypothetical protein
MVPTRGGTNPSWLTFSPRFGAGSRTTSVRVPARTALARRQRRHSFQINRVHPRRETLVNQTGPTEAALAPPWGARRAAG